ncbi:MAG: dolichol kinase [Leptospiraceae bacterium]|nr:dolichol kinase [Leptospiraceae bacterium]MCP5496016.1 dolichol kinase [Leptospiraceae bacterium]
MGNFNYYRKGWHLLGFIIPLIYYFDIFKGRLELVYATRAIIFTFLVFFIVVLIVIDFIRLRNEAFNQLFIKIFSKLLKEEESARMNATLPYMVANAAIVLFFPAEIYFLSMGFLLIGDPFAAFFGSKYGKYRFYNGKSLVGIVAFITSSFLAGLLLLYFFSLTSENLEFSLYKNNVINLNSIFLLLIGSVSAGLTEFFSGHALGGFLDDNLTIPVISAIVIVISAVYIFGVDSNTVFLDFTKVYNRIN